jgi:hypothetical protein
MIFFISIQEGVRKVRLGVSVQYLSSAVFCTVYRAKAYLVVASWSRFGSCQR